ncbi:MAG: hypothetical protein KDM63_08555 [Verrucomicrobiae bacterium]|nr:hypothetical protein [Verrucomicrobiae bacterium]MCB1093556.1 hypothetical protein [Verrucomicrobiae bacterium]
MPAVAIKISEEVAELVRRAAAAADRSMAGQVEHWARLAMDIEDRATVTEVNAIKAMRGDLANIEDASMRERVTAVLGEVRQGKRAATTRETLREGGLPLYESDPDDPERIIEVAADGTRRRGRFVDRVFVPET